MGQDDPTGRSPPWGRTRVERDGVLTEPNAATNGTVGGVLLGKDYIGSTGHPYRVSFRSQTVRGALAWKFDPFGTRP